MTIPKACKRLAEVDFPIAVVSQHAASDKYVRNKPNTTLHTWWAQRPLAACRSLLLALLLPDPTDPHCPAHFKNQARAVLAHVPGPLGSTDEDLQRALFSFIGNFSAWENASHPLLLDAARKLVRAAWPDERPLVVDPFSGGGSIPLEAIRIGGEALATDLNPVACLLERVMLNEIPQSNTELVGHLRKAAEEVKRNAGERLARFYPPDEDGARPIAYLWARTIRCEAPNCGAEMPLISSFWLRKKARKYFALRYSIIRLPNQPPQVEFELFAPNETSEVPNATIRRAKARCLCCGGVLAPDRVRLQLAAQKGGADVIFDDRGQRISGATLLAVVTWKVGDEVRRYRAANQHDYEAVYWANCQLQTLALEKLSNGVSILPDESLPPIGTLGFRVQRYGMLRWRDLFTSRQCLALAEISRVIRDDSTRSTLVNELLAFALDKFARHCNGNARWNNVVESTEPAFGSQTLPITWTFPESVPWGKWAENFDGSVEAILKCLERGYRGITRAAQVQVEDAVNSPLPDASCDVWFTDPPYYDAVPYADLSDFFYVWLKRSLPDHPLLRDPFDPGNDLTPKDREIVEDTSKRVNGRRKDKVFFEAAAAKAFAEGRRILKEEGIGCVVFAHKTTEGWEALLSGLTRGGWVLTASWPIATERSGRLRARDSAALAASVHLVCRPRPTDAPVGDWAEVYRELPNRVANWMERLQSEGVRGADLVFACIGPALEIYSRYSKVVDPEDREIPLGGDPEAREPHKRGYLAYVWEVVGRAALEQILGTAEARARNGAAGALEEDARLTALFLWTIESTAAEETETTPNDAEPDEPDDDEGAPRTRRKGFTLMYDVVRRFAQPLGIHLEQWDKRIIDTEKGVVRLIPVAERAEQLFGPDGAQSIAARLEATPPNELEQLGLFPASTAETAPAVRGARARRGRRTADGDSPRVRAVGERDPKAPREATTLDRVHAAMLLQRNGSTTALRRLLEAERDRGPDFLRLANALSALYPPASDEKRLLDAMLLAAPR